jgi:probable F420-dependent oxidoreductase
MRVETLLPLGKLDPGLRAAETPLDLRRVGEDARLVESLGYDGLAVEETKDDPYVVMALAAQATTRVRLTTAIAMAFPRSPTIILGLGSQVRGHIVRRFGLDYRPPGPWMRDYVRAVRAVWTSWQERTPLAFESAHYRLSLMVPLFDPGPIAHPEIPIHIAAVNPTMCRIAGEVADGMRPHPVCTPKYIREVMLPAVARGAQAAGRDPAQIAIAMKPLICTAPDAETLQKRVRDVRARVAFYASTPGYRAAFDAHGLTDLAVELAQLSKAQRWEEMPPRISDDVLHTYAVVGTYDEIGKRLIERYRGLITDVEFSIPAGTEQERNTLRDLVRDIQRG